MQSFIGRSAVRLFLFAPAAGLAPLVGAVPLTLTTDHPVGTPQLAFANSTGTGGMFVKVVNASAPNAAADLMAAWQFQVTLVAQPGAVGTLTFNNPTAATPPNPPNYVFAGGSGIAATKSSGNTVLDANDFNASLAGSQVPAGSGANLLQIDFNSSAGAVGTWGVFAVRGSDKTLWSDAATPFPQTRFFANVPDGTGTVQIGEINVVLPEPASLLWVGAGTLLCRRRRRVARQAV